jgi:uncharacterized membrane protein
MLGYDAPRWHALLNDFPAALLVVAVVFDLAAATGKRESLKWAAAWTLWAGVLGGWAAVVAGELAEDAIDHGEAIHDIMTQHERRALVTMSIFTVILVWKMYRRFALPTVELWATRVLGIVGVVGLCYVGAAGGKLVFEHGAGIPTKMMEAEIENREAGHHHEPGEEAEEHEHDHGAPADSAKTTHVDPPGTPPHKH